MRTRNSIASILTACLAAVGVRGRAAVVNTASTQVTFRSWLRSSNGGLGQSLRGSVGTVILAASVLLFIAGMGAAIFYFGSASRAVDWSSTIPSSRFETDGDLARLKDYTRSIETKGPASTAAAGDLMPDVNTMIERLAARLASAPNDINGWRMLGWSYFNTARYDLAATAYAKALALDPTSAETKRLHEEARTKGSESGNQEASVPSQAATSQRSGDGPVVEKTAKGETMPREYDAAVRSMVDGLAARLETSPRDVDGWTRLMRSRIVLGERDVAAAAYSTALNVFKEDAAALDKIKAMAVELGLNAE